MAAFNEWWEEAREALVGFTDKGVAHLAWDAAIKSLEGVQTQPTNSTKPVICQHAQIVCRNDGEECVGTKDSCCEWK